MDNLEGGGGGSWEARGSSATNVGGRQTRSHGVRIYELAPPGYLLRTPKLEL